MLFLFMNNEILNQFFNIQSSTIDDVKVLLKDIKNNTNNELTKKILELEKQLKKIQKAKRYWLVFEEKPEEFEQKAKDALPLLKEEKELEILEKDSKKPTNIIIEWDNFHSLSCLKYTHQNKIDVIYIDPPYNTWNKDFIYNDRFVDKEDSYRHSKWLSFMKKRLILAKDLLSEKWVIFISIDDNEQAQLKMLCDEIFWEQNFIWTFVINSTPNARDYWHIWKMHEYCLFYSKFYLKTETNLLEEKEKIFSYKDNIGWFNIHPLYNSNEAFTNLNRPNLYYPFYLNPYKNDENLFYEISLEYNSNYIEIYPSKSVKNDIQFVWRWGKNKAQENLNKEIIWYKTNNWEFRIVQKMRHSSKLIRSMLSDTQFTSRKGTAEIEEVFQDKIFNFPKPLNLIKNFIKISTSNSSIILDFFAWSWTTGHAVLELNKEDWWNRQFILCSNKEATKENPDKNICKDITYERNKRVIQWYINAKWEKVEWLGWNLKYYTTDFIKIEKSIDDLRYKFINMCDDLLCIKENTFEKVKLNFNDKNPNISPFLKGSPKEWGEGFLKLYKNNSNYTVILYDIFHFEDLLKLVQILNWKIKIYIFSLSKEIYEEELSYLEKNIEIANIPDDILETYKKIFNF